MTALAQQSSTALFATLAQGSLDGAWILDPSKSSVLLKTKSMWGLARIGAVFTDLQGEVAVVAGAVTARVAVGTGSIDTKNAKRDEHLKSHQDRRLPLAGYAHPRGRHAGRGV